MEENNKFNINQSDDDFIIGKGFQLDAEDEKKASNKRKRKKGSGTIKNIIWILTIIVVSVALAFGIIYAGADFMGIGFGRGEHKCEINIEMGTPASAIAQQLEESGAVNIPMLFRVYSKLKGYDNQFKYGYYNFESESGYEAICQMLISEGAKAETITVTIPEGIGINDYTKNVNGENVTVPGIGTLLEKAGVCTKSDFLAALNDVKLNSKLLSSADDEKTYHTLEGYLFPETYDFYSYDSKECAALAIEKMLKESSVRITDKMHARAEEMGYTMNEILTLASIVQMEAGKNTEGMAMVAGIFYNRLKSDEFATLGSSPTCYYGNSFKYDDGRYNTYNVKGLPPGPLCSPGIDAINAALYPESSDYYYFVTDKDGNFYYHKTLNEQQKTINQLKQGNNWIYEYFD